MEGTPECSVTVARAEKLGLPPRRLRDYQRSVLLECLLDPENLYAYDFAILRQVHHHVLGHLDALPIAPILQLYPENVLLFIVVHIDQFLTCLARRQS